MKDVIILLIVIASIAACSSTEQTASEEAASSPYDSLLAVQWGADDYGMRKYVMAFLKAGPQRNQDSAAAAQIQAGHNPNG